MKTTMKTVLIAWTVLISSVALAAPTKKQTQKKVRTPVVAKNTVKPAGKSQVKSQVQGDYQTNMAFDGTQLNGRLAEGSLRKIVVENDKSLDDLLGVRKKFDDREQEESQRNASW